MQDARIDEYDHAGEVLTSEQLDEILAFLELHVPVMLQAIRDAREVHGPMFMAELVRFLYDDLQRLKAGVKGYVAVFDKRMLWKQ